MPEKRGLLRRQAAARKYAFDGIDHVSSWSFPYNTSFESSGPRPHTARIFGLSGLAVIPQTLTLLAVCDRSALLTASIAYNHTSWALTGITWDRHWHMTGHAGADIDSEAVTLQHSRHSSGRDVYIAAEGPAAIYKVPNVETWQHQSEIIASRMSLLSVAPMDSNKGPEGLSTAQSRAATNHNPPVAVAAMEGPVEGDDPSIRRLIDIGLADGSGGFQAAVRLPQMDPPLYISEINLLQPGGLSGGAQMLLLTRGWTEETGNRVCLYLLDAAQASDIRTCQGVVDGSGDAPECDLSMIQLVQVTPLLDWSREAPLHGLTTDNYEGMTLVPPEVLGLQSEDALRGIMLLLVNDNNDSPDQGEPGFNGTTQFVSFRLRFAPSP